jgi:hypothetical protein
MKAQKMNCQRVYLQNAATRWKWMIGATAATAAGVTASQANTITINLVDNFISGSGGNHLDADLTGDGNPDLTINGAQYSFRYHTDNGHVSTSLRNSFASVVLNGVLARAIHTSFPFEYARLGSQTANYIGPPAPSLTGSIPITFTDLHINHGALTHGLLEVSVITERPARVQLDSITYQLPDNGSSLGLLAMGASGILAVRRWRADRGGL